jgi:hypothetical protein
MEKDITPKKTEKQNFGFKKDAFKMLYAVGILCLLLGAIAWPFASIWALNSLFTLSIKYTFWNWLACWILIMTFQGAINIKREKIVKIKE